MMSFMVGDEVPQEYVPMMMEELALDGVDSRAFHWDKPVSAEQKQQFKVLIIGAGMSGLLAAIRLEEAGIPYVVVEKNEAVGGTWFENSYPGCRVDSPNHFYSFSFEPNHGWPEFFSRRDELFAYFNRCMDKFGIRPHIRFSTEVTSARYAEDERDLERRTQDPKTAERRPSRSTRSSPPSGQLNRPKLPDLPGLDTFPGPSGTPPQWQHQHDLKGKTIAVIGTGASAFQIVPEVAKIAGTVKVFQRSAPWMFPNPQYHAVVERRKKVAADPSAVLRSLVSLPAVLCQFRRVCCRRCKIDPQWPHQDRSISSLNDRIRQNLVANIKSQIGDNPELLEKVIPKYPPFGNRVLVDNGSWLATMKRDNVELITDGIREIVKPTESSTATGKRHVVDIIVYATGFHTNKFLSPMEIIGKGGANLRKSGATRRAPTWASPCRASPICFWSMDRPPTWPTAAASFSIPSARSAT